MSEWGLEWELPEYPQLPKLFTNAKTAKKRKHKEFIVTEELLEQPVKLPKLLGTANKPGKPNSQQPAAEAAAAVKSAQIPAKKGAKQQQQQQQQQQKEAKTMQQATQAADSGQVTIINLKQKKGQHGDANNVITTHQQQLQQQHDQAEEQQQQPQGQQQQQQQQTQGKKGKKHKQKGSQQPPLDHQNKGAAEGEAGGRTPAVDESATPKQQKKTRNKFKQPDFLALQQQQQQQQQPAEQQLTTHAAQDTQLAAVAAAPAIIAAAASDGIQAPQHKKHKKDQQHRQRQQQPAAAQPVSAPTAATAATAASAAAAAAAKPSAASSSGGSKLLHQFRERLAGSRFRQLNEALYTQPGEDSFSQMQQQPELFTQYHEGFQQQVKSWPTQPLDVAINWLKDKPANCVVVDYGCGEARLAATVKQTVHSLDLVAAAPGVIACNMAQSPLSAASCNAAVFSLALMGTDYGEFLLDAARVLKKGGWLWIAEVRSRFAGGKGSEDFRPFLFSLQQLGFKLVKQDTKNRMFVVFVLKKQQQVDAATATGIHWPPLKACLYKKR